MTQTRAAAASEASGIAGLEAVVQILVHLKSLDPTALTAAEAIRHLLGLGDHLESIQRRQLCELHLALAGPPADLDTRLSDYLERTVLFWNPNKHRAWVRRLGPAGPAEAWEAIGKRRQAGSFGNPSLEDREYDHVLIWSRDEEAAPSDLDPALLPWNLRIWRRAELYSLRWAEGCSGNDRASWLERVAVARSRTDGLLVNPHYQDHRLLRGRVPIPVWGNSGSAGTA